jgi:hypothetical protein
VTIAGKYADLGDLDNAYKWIDKAIEVRVHDAILGAHRRGAAPKRSAI